MSDEKNPEGQDWQRAPALLAALALGCSSSPVMSWEQPDGGGLVHCFVDGERVTSRHDAEKALGPPCRTETDDGPSEVYMEAFYCASPGGDGWTLEACSAGCHEYRWAYVGVTPVSCRPAR